MDSGKFKSIKEGEKMKRTFFISWANAQYCSDNLSAYKIPFKIAVDASGRCALEVGDISPEQLEKMPAYIKKLLGGPQKWKK